MRYNVKHPVKLIIVSIVALEPCRPIYSACVRRRCASHPVRLRKSRHEVETESWQVQTDAERYRCASHPVRLRKSGHELETGSWQVQADAETNLFLQLSRCLP